MKIWEVLKNAYAKIDSILNCAVLYVAATWLDNISSLHFPPGISESNPFARHADGTFWLKHALITEGFNTLEIVFVSAGCYIGARMLGSKWAKFAAGLPWLIFGYLHLDAAFQNFLVEWPGLYQISAQDILRHLLGQ